jgi:hypothetical protein
MLGAGVYSPRGETLTDPELPIIKAGERKSKLLGNAIRIEFGGGQLKSIEFLECASRDSNYFLVIKPYTYFKVRNSSLPINEY